MSIEVVPSADIVDEQETERRTIQDDFNKWEQEMTENIRGETVPKGMYTQAGSFKDLLRSVLTGPEAVTKNRIEEAWTGSISVERRPDITRESIKAALQPSNIDKYYVIASSKARTRCIDGRCIECYGESENTAADRPLGAQTPGGTVTAALCDRIAAWDSIHTNAFNLVEDVRRMQDIFMEIGFVPGGHVDDHAPENMTGCGAIDKVPEILARITDPTAQKQIRTLTRMILGDNYHQGTVDSVMGRLLSLEGMSEEYFSQDENGDYLYRKDAIEALRKADTNGVVKLTGKHNEVGLVVNFVKNTTFHRDQFSVDNDHKIQLFNYDFWRTVEVAERLHPANTGNDLTDKQNERLRARYITVRTLFAVGTAMVLTDGSIDLIVRQPEPVGDLQAA